MVLRKVDDLISEQENLVDEFIYEGWDCNGEIKKDYRYCF